MKYMCVSSAGGHLSELLKIKVTTQSNSIIVTEKTDSVKEKNYLWLRYGTRAHKFSYPFIFLSNCVRAYKYLKKYRPEVLISTGAHSCVPFFILAKRFGITTIYVESFAKVTSTSMTYRLIKKYADYVIVQHQEAKDIYQPCLYFGGVY